MQVFRAVDSDGLVFMARKARFLNLLVRFRRSRRANVTVMFALMLVPLIGIAGVATEGAGWFLTQRAVQHGADEAALAAALNGCVPGATCATVQRTYAQEATAVAAKYNFVSGSNDTTVTPSLDTATAPCAAAPNNCYVVTIQHKSPFRLMRIVGFTGDTTAGSGAQAQTISAKAMAMRMTTNNEFCITALSSSSTAFLVNGGAQLNLTGCPIYTPNGGARCNGNFPPMQSFVAVAGSQQNCGLESVSQMSWTDSAYRNLATQNNLSTVVSKCNGVYKQGTGKNSNFKVTAPENLLSGTKSFSASTPQCGDQQLPGDLTITGNSTLVIANGTLDLAGHTLTVASNASLTIVFTGTAGSSAGHYPWSSQNGGVMNFSAPSSGAWQGVAIYQDPALTTSSGIDWTLSGNNPQFDITGLIYAPNANLTLSGAINHATAGLACLDIIANQITVSGTAAIFAQPTVDCTRAGVTPPGAPTLQKAVLVG